MNFAVVVPGWPEIVPSFQRGSSSSVAQVCRRKGFQMYWFAAAVVAVDLAAAGFAEAASVGLVLLRPTSGFGWRSVEEG